MAAGAGKVSANGVALSCGTSQVPRGDGRTLSCLPQKLLLLRPTRDPEMAAQQSSHPEKPLACTIQPTLPLVTARKGRGCLPPPPRGLPEVNRQPRPPRPIPHKTAQSVASSHAARVLQQAPRPIPAARSALTGPGERPSAYLHPPPSSSRSASSAGPSAPSRPSRTGCSCRPVRRQKGVFVRITWAPGP